MFFFEKKNQKTFIRLVWCVNGEATPLRRVPPLYSTAAFPAGGDGLPGYAHAPMVARDDLVRGGDKPEGDPMPLYETVFIARNDVTQQQVEAIADAIAAQLETEGGAVKKREYWGLRSLAYRIKKNRKGHYMLLGLDATPASVNEMERQLGLNEDVLRFMTIRVDAIDEAPCAILSRKSDDRERGFRGPKPAGRFDSGRTPRLRRPRGIPRPRRRRFRATADGFRGIEE